MLKTRPGKPRLIKIMLLLAALLLIAPVALGCVEGLQPIGWSGGAISGDNLYVGTKEGRLARVNTENQEIIAKVC